MNRALLTLFFLFTGLFSYAQSHETVSYNLNGTPANGMKIKTNLPYTNSSQMVNIKIEGYCYGAAASIGLNIVYYIYNDAFVNNSVSSWGAYTPDIYLSNESGLVCITLADKPYFPRFKVSAFAKGMPAETAANFTGWTVVDEVAAGINITAFPYKNVVRNLTVKGTGSTDGSLIANGSSSIGPNTLSNVSLTVNKMMSGATSTVGLYSLGVIQSDVTGSAQLFGTMASTQATSFNLLGLHHYRATQGTFGVGSTVGSQYGFFVDATLVGAANNYAFSGNIPGGSGRYNLFMSGTAQNYLNGPTSIGTGSVLAAQLATIPASDAIKGIVVKAFSPTQTANLLEAQNSTGAVISGISNGGSLFSTNTIYAPALGNTVSSNNSLVSLNATGTIISRNVSDAADVLTVTNANATSTGYIQNWKFGSVSRMSLSAAGNLTLSTMPATSAGTYNILTHNSTTGVVEKIASSALDVPWTGVIGKPTTLVGYGITDAYSSTNFRALPAPNSAGGTDANIFLNGHTASYYTSSWLSNGYFTGTAGYGGLISFPYSTSSNGALQLNYSWGHGTSTGGGIAFRSQKIDGTFTTWKELYHSGNLNNLNQLGTRNFSDLQSKPTTLTGYGITDGATSTSVTAVQASITTLDGNAVHKAGTETITGRKHFDGGVAMGLASGVAYPTAYKLAVGGGIIAESVKVKPQLEWPDYVFEKDYLMLSLPELEAFIVKNKHLPDVPASAEVKKDGLDLAEMDSKLLKKIEELTLYLIEKDKEIKRLSEEKEEEKKRQSVKDKEIKVLSEMVKELSEDIKAIKNKQNH